MISRAIPLVLCIVCSAARAADPAPAVSPEPFFRHADYGALALSPSGKYIGALVPVQGRMGLAVLDIDGKSIKNIANPAEQDVGWFEWVNEERLVFSLVDLQKGLGEQTGGGLFAINRDGTDFRELVPTAKASMDRMSRRHGARVLRMLRDGSDDIVLAVNELSERYPDVYRVNTRTGRRTLKSLDKPGDVVEWFADRAGAARAAVVDEKDEGGTRVYWRPTEDAKWIEIGHYGIRGPRMQPVDFDGDGSLIVASDEGRGTFALYRYDAAKKGLGELIAAHPTSDLDDASLVFDRRKNRFVGMRYEAERPGEAWFDDDWARLAKGVNNALPDHANFIQREDADRALIYSSSDRDPGSYYLLDLKTSRLEPLVARRKAIHPENMPKRTPLRYAARDGLSIPAYLTLPPGKTPRNLPLVVHVHGGPYVHGNHWEWDPEAAYLATLGYAVLQPEFRGSMGWGRKLYEAGWKQWGGGMQDDLDDGVDHLVKEGIVDPARVCIMGGSYGGYAVMMSLARDPARWKCGVNIVGVTDIGMMYDVTWSDFFDSDWMRYHMKDLIGDPDKDAAMLKASSPLANAAHIKAPVLMAYGGQDRRVPPVHGERMRDALQKQGTPVEWVEYGDEGHGFMVEATRYDLYRRIARFLDANIGAAAPR
ncbi:MAG TPA: prolyl oligopeptidase family serine peptidase [Casimicrobiaceae bacterium]|nr:prolyl oligopeptidase family serine peptidase [Casimicrobiaceae bacterium]